MLIDRLERILYHRVAVVGVDLRGGTLVEKELWAIAALCRVEHLEAQISYRDLAMFHEKEFSYEFLEIVLDFDEQVCSLFQCDEKLSLLSSVVISFASDNKEPVCYFHVSLQFKYHWDARLLRSDPCPVNR